MIKPLSEIPKRYDLYQDKRYDLYQDWTYEEAYMEPKEDGPWIMFTEYERIVAEHKAAYTLDTIAEYEKGYWEGESAALRRVREAMEDCFNRIKKEHPTEDVLFGAEFFKLMLKRELFGDEGSGNYNYTNKGEK